MNHQLISTGAGWRCLRCKVAWDQGEAEPEECAAGDEYGFVTDLPGERPLVVEAGLWKPVHTFESGSEPAYFVDAKPRFFSAGGLPTPTSPTPPHPMTAQVAGSHYKTLAIQPTEFCMRNSLDFCIGSILKYVTRHRAKNGREDLLKAKHFIEIRQTFLWHIRSPGRIEITMLEYVTRNGIRPDDADVLYRLEAYYNNHLDGGTKGGARRLIEEIDRLIAITY